MTSAGLAPMRSSSVRAVGAVPMTQTAPGPAAPYATRIPAAERVMCSRPANFAVRGSRIGQMTGRAVMPAAVIAESATIGAPAASARTPAASAASSQTRSVR